MKPHKHAEVLRGIADGKEFQCRKDSSWDWRCADLMDLIYNFNFEFRVKPEPTPDEVYYVVAEINNNVFKRNIIENNDCFSFLSKHKTTADNLKLTFDGETGKLMNAEVL